MIKLDINIGDTILVGRFKNKRIEVKEFGIDEHGLPTVNGRSILKIRIEKLMKTKKQIKESIDYDETEVNPSFLIKDNEYVWIMGAEPLLVYYTGRGKKPGTYNFEFKDEKGDYDLSRRGVKEYIKYKEGTAPGPFGYNSGLNKFKQESKQIKESVLYPELQKGSAIKVHRHAGIYIKGVVTDRKGNYISYETINGDFGGVDLNSKDLSKTIHFAGLKESKQFSLAQTAKKILKESEYKSKLDKQYKNDHSDLSIQKKNVISPDNSGPWATTATSISEYEVISLSEKKYQKNDILNWARSIWKANGMLSENVEKVMEFKDMWTVTVKTTVYQN